MDKFVCGHNSFYFFGKYNKNKLMDVFSRFTGLDVADVRHSTIINVRMPTRPNNGKVWLGTPSNFFYDTTRSVWNAYEDSFFTYRELPLLLFAETAFELGLFCVNGTVIEINGRGVLILYKSNIMKARLLMSLFQQNASVRLVSDELSILSITDEGLIAKKIDGFIYNFGIEISKAIPVITTALDCQYVKNEKLSEKVRIDTVWLLNVVEGIDQPFVYNSNLSPMKFILAKRWPTFFARASVDEAAYQKFKSYFQAEVDQYNIKVKQICLNDHTIDLVVSLFERLAQDESAC